MTEKKEEPGGVAVADERKPMLMDVRDLAFEIGVAVDTCRDMTRRHDIPIPQIRLGNQIRFRRDIFELWIRSGCPRVSLAWENVMRENDLEPYQVKAGR